MRPIRAIRDSDERSDQSGGTPGRTGRRNYGSVRPHCESSPPRVGRSHAWGPVSESPLATPAPVWAHCHTPHRLAPAVKPEGQGTERPTQRWVERPPKRVRPLPSDSHHWLWLQSPPRLTALPTRHKRGGAPCRICRDPRGWLLFVRPFFCGLLGAIEQHLLPVDPLQSFVTLGHLLPCAPKGVLRQPDLEPPLHGFVGRK